MKEIIIEFSKRDLNPSQNKVNLKIIENNMTTIDNFEGEGARRGKKHTTIRDKILSLFLTLKLKFL